MVFRCVLVVSIVVAACGNPPSSDPFDAAVVDASIPDAGIDAEPQLADLMVNQPRAEIDLAIQTKTFEVDSCELEPDENCIGAAGERKLLHFSVETPNVGTADMVLGAPSSSNPQFQYSVCHDHFHFVGYAEYELLDSTGTPAATGQKQAFCLLDSEKFLTEDPTVADNSEYWCGFQGIQRGWADVYHSRLPCQFIDITDTPDGDYTLRISINNGGTLPELTMDNNVVEIPVTLSDPNLITPTEACDPGYDEHTSDGLNRECGWTLDQTFNCTPGTNFTVGCAQACDNTGSCTGDPMLRVCDAAAKDGNCSFPSAIEFDDDSCNTKCPFVFNERCPDSGQIVVYHAPFRVGEAYTCNVEFKPGP